LELQGGIQAFVAVDLGVAEFGGGGGLKAEVSFDFNDPDHDGRIYLQEIEGAFHHDNALQRLIDVHGQISVTLDGYAKLLFLTYEKQLAETTLYSFSSEPTNDEPTPVLGAQDAQGVLRLNMGSRAGERLYRGETTDGDEVFTITAGSNA